ncbi:MAG: HAD family hydrolase [Halofilum sp. (in: g-proteobacteria)]
MTLEALLVDFGGVVAREGFRAGLRAIGRAHGIEPDRLEAVGREAVHESGYVTGDGSEHDFWRLVRDRTGLRGDDLELSAVILENFIVREWMLDYVRRVRARGILVAILSDQTDWLESLDRRDRFSRDFDRIFNSYRLGRSKRDPELFDQVVATLGIAPRAALFVDDTAAHVERARARGLNGIVYRDRRQLARELVAWPELPVLGHGNAEGRGPAGN